MDSENRCVLTSRVLDAKGKALEIILVLKAQFENYWASFCLQTKYIM